MTEATSEFPEGILVMTQRRRWFALTLASLLAVPVFVFGAASPAAAEKCVNVVVDGLTIPICIPG
jgi:hypothetical protein